MAFALSPVWMERLHARGILGVWRTLGAAVRTRASDQAWRQDKRAFLRRSRFLGPLDRRWRTGRLSHDAETLRLDPVLTVRQACAEAAETARKAGVALVEPIVAPGLAVRAPHGRLTLLMTALIENAIRHSRGGGSVAATVTASARDVRIMIHDDGQPPFVAQDSVSAAAPRSVSGVASNPFWGGGAWLARVRRQADEMGGRLEVVFDASGGSSTILVLPREQLSPTPPAYGPLPRGVVLCVGGAVAEAALMRHAVCAHGFLSAHGVATAEEALDVVADVRADVILIDMDTPGLDGMALASTLAIRPETRLTPLLALTARPRPADGARGFHDWLSKPLNGAAHGGASQNNAALGRALYEALKFREAVRPAPVRRQSRA